MMALLDLTCYSHNKPLSLYKISERQGLSLDYLEQIFTKLRQNGIVKAVKGPGGGYLLARASENTTIAEIITAVSGKIKTVRCEGACNCESHKGNKCLAHNIWESLDCIILNHLNSLSLASVIKKTKIGTNV